MKISSLWHWSGRVIYLGLEEFIKKISGFQCQLRILLSLWLQIGRFGMNYRKITLAEDADKRHLGQLGSSSHSLRVRIHYIC